MKWHRHRWSPWRRIHKLTFDETRRCECGLVQYRTP